MNNYEKEIYQYFTEESHFRKMIAISQHALVVKRQLMLDFWESLLKELENRVSENYKEWEVSTYGDSTISWGKILIHKLHHKDRGEDNLPLLAIGIQRIMDRQYPFYGIFLNNKTKKYNVEDVISYIRNIEVIKDWSQDNDKWWPRWKMAECDFRNEDDYVKILPEKREVTINSICNSLVNLIELLSDEMDNIYTRKK